MRLTSFLVLGAGFLTASASVFAHHGTSASYQADKMITLNGTVTEWAFSYPHPQIYFDVKDANGNVQHWATEFNSTPFILKSLKVGWSKDSLKPGDQIVLGCNPPKAANALACLAKDLTVNGKKMPFGQDAFPTEFRGK